MLEVVANAGRQILVVLHQEEPLTHATLVARSPLAEPPVKGLGRAVSRRSAAEGRPETFLKYESYGYETYLYDSIEPPPEAAPVTHDDPIERHLPLKAVVFHILLALIEEPRHGYGIVQAVRARSEERIRLKTGPLYRHLRKLLDLGWVEESNHRPPDVDSRRGAYYRITARGREVASAEATRLRALLATTGALGLPSSGDGA